MRGAVAAIIMAVVATSAVAEIAGSDFEIDTGFVRTWADAFTDEYNGTILLLSGIDGASDGLPKTVLHLAEFRRRASASGVVYEESDA